MEPQDPYAHREPEGGSWAAHQEAGGQAPPEEASPESQTWDTFAGGSLAWGDSKQSSSELDVGYLTDQHPQASEVGITDTEAGAQFFGADEEEVWHTREGHGDVLLGGGKMDRNLGKAILSALGFVALAIVCFRIGRWPTLILLILMLILAARELYGALRSVGYKPAVFVGISAVIGLPLAVFWRGAQAFPLGIGLAFIVTCCWYLVGLSPERPIPNIGATLFSVVYLAVLGSFGALLLRESNGVGLFLGAVVATAAYDSFAWAVGKVIGRTQLSKVSPNKTVEGLFGGILGAVLVCWLILGLLKIDPWGENPGSMLHVIVLGAVAAIAATIGDLSESMFKRDFGLKDMGKMIPGHGGVLDRFDGLLFVLPVTWGLALVTGVIEAAPS